MFAGDSAVLGRDLVIQKEHFTVIGVTPEGFKGLTVDGTDVWTPLGPPAPNGRMALIARLKPGADERQLAAGATVAFRRVRMGPTDKDTTRSIVARSIIPGRRFRHLSTQDTIALRIGSVWRTRLGAQMLAEGLVLASIRGMAALLIACGVAARCGRC